MNQSENPEEIHRQKIRKPFKDTLLIFMVIAFVTLATTGLLKFHSLTRFINIDTSTFPMQEITTLHDWSGLILILLIITHLIVQRGWFAYMWREFKKLLSTRTIVILAALAISILAILTLIYLNRNPKSTSEEIKQLADVQVKEYQGENLSSIEDFRENSIKGPQYIDIEKYILTIDGLVQYPLELTYDEVLEFDNYEKVVTLHCVEGWNATILWEGVLIKDLLDEAEVDDSAHTVIFRSYDGYTTSLSIDFIRDNDILLAYKMNDVTLPPERGYPFQVVAEDKWGYKWAKWVTEIELSDDDNFKGYWEKAGYNNDGSFDGPKFEN